MRESKRAMNDAEQERFLRKNQVCSLLGVSVSTLDRWIKAGRFPKGTPIGTKVRVWPYSEVSGFVSAHSGEAAAV